MSDAPNTDRDPVEIVFDAVQAVLDAHLEQTSQWSALDVKRFSELAKSYIAQTLSQSRKRCREEEYDHDHDGCDGHHDSEAGVENTEAECDAALQPVLTDTSDVADALFRHMNRVRSTLRPIAPFGSIAEEIHRPTLNPNFEAQAPTVDVDAFLFDQDDIDNLVEEGKLSRHYCRACQSTNIGETQFISHSFSTEQLVYLFSYALPLVAQEYVPEETRKQLSICDVGSRLGIVLAAASFFTKSSAPQRGPATSRARTLEQSTIGFKNVVGIELNQQLCDIQRAIVSKLRIDPAVVNIFCGDALSEEGLKLMVASDIVVLHNVFEWFREESKQLQVWRTLRSMGLNRSGQIIVAVPTIENSLSHLAEVFKETDLDSVDAVKSFVDDWVQRVDINEAVELFKRERLFAEEDGGGCDDDDEAREARDETLELVSLINVYVVK